MGAGEAKRDCYTSDVSDTIENWFGLINYTLFSPNLPQNLPLAQTRLYPPRCSEGEGAPERITKSQKLLIFGKAKPMAKDLYHDNLRRALEKDGWLITHDPYELTVDAVD